jgi:cytoskeletal protein RodZ
MDLQSIGRMLRQTREERELTLDDAENTLRIRQRILESFELGEFDLTGFSPVQINGFIRNYARWLGLDEEQILDNVLTAKDETLRRGRRKDKRASQETRAVQDARTTQELRMSGPARVTDTHPTMPVRRTARQANGSSTATRSPGEQRRGGGLLRGILIAALAVGSLALIAFVVVQYVLETPIGEFDSIAPDGILSPMPAIATFTLAPTLPPTFTPPPAAGSSFFSGSGVAVQLTLGQRSWLRIEVDGAERFEGVARPGTVFEFAASSSIAVRAANAAALEVVYNGQRQNTFGARGQRVDLVFGTSGVQISSGQSFSEPTLAVSDTPIPTTAPDVGTLIAAQTPSATSGPSPTASNTPQPTETPTVTFTPSLTFTPSATFTASATPSATSTPGPSPTATAILPVREPLFTPTATKTG